MKLLIFFLSLSACFGLPLVADQPAEFYEPIEREIEGWTVVLDPALFEPEHQEVSEEALKALANHLQRVRYIVPADRLARLREVRIWVDWEHKLGPMQYHPDRGWLLANGFDPRLAKHVHIPRVKRLLDSRQWAKHPYCVLHELAHAYHDQVLSFHNPEVVEAFKQIKKEESYAEALSHEGKRVKHYGLTNPMEYFAESTEAYLGVNDFYPFVRAELKQHDPRMFALMERVWGKVQ